MEKGRTTTKKQGEETRKKILEAIVGFILDRGYPPTIREIGCMVGLKSTSSVSSHLEIMRSQGMIIMKDASPRSIVVPGVRCKDERKSP